MKYILKRQDDNGHVFEVESFERREDAERVCRGTDGERPQTDVLG